MKRHLIAILAVLLAEPVSATDTTNLAEMLSIARQNPGISRKTMPLDRDWIGDIEDETGEVTRLRLEKGRIQDGWITLVRIYPTGSYREIDAPVYFKTRARVPRHFLREHG